MKTIFSTTMWVGKGTVFVVGLSVILAAVFALAATAFAANGQPFLLGRSNAATAVSTLVKSGPGPALRLLARPGNPPMAVNTRVKVANFNADFLDGQDSSAFLAANGKAADADLLDGLDSSAFVPTNTNSFIKNNTYRNESTVDAGQQLSDGTFTKNVSCNAGDRMLSGGPANINPTTDMVESFPSSTTSWTARVDKNAQTDNYSVVVLCADQ